MVGNLIITVDGKKVFDGIGKIKKNSKSWTIYILKNNIKRKTTKKRRRK